MSRFASFWKGTRLSAFEASCLHSFVDRGHEVTLFSYEPVADVPRRVIRADAATIVDQSSISNFIIDGKPSISHFSDYFRYIMFAKTELTWIDTDVMLLRGWPLDPDRNLLTLETPRSICNAVMRVRSDEAWLPELIKRTAALQNTPMRWGETGPRLISKLVGEQALLLEAEPPHLHFPIHFDDFWKAFLPEYADECRTLCDRARTLHLWNNIVDRLGFWKDYMPPTGSYLHRLFVDKGCAQYFRGEFPVKNMRQLVENWHSRQTGQHLGIRSVVNQLVPSVRRTLRHYVG